MTHSAIKQDLVRACSNYVEERIARIKNAINDLEDALKLETKCSMGDKYETGRAMLHLEFEKLSSQLEQFERLRKTLCLVTARSGKGTVGFGSGVKTSQANYFLSVPAGEIVAGDEKYYAVGATSPIAQALMNKEQGDTISFNGRDFVVLEVF